MESFVYLKTRLSELYPDAVDVKLKYLNSITSTPNDEAWLDHDHWKIKIKFCIPRPMKIPFERPPEERPNAPWTFDISIFKDYLGETESLVA